MPRDPRVKAYLQRLITGAGRGREAFRCLKRYIARELNPLLLADPEATALSDVA